MGEPCHRDCIAAAEARGYAAGYGDGCRAGRDGRLAEEARVAAAEKRGRVAAFREVAHKARVHDTVSDVEEWCLFRAEEVERS